MRLTIYEQQELEFLHRVVGICDKPLHFKPQLSIITINLKQLPTYSVSDYVLISRQTQQFIAALA